MSFYVRLGPHGLIIAIGAILHSKLGRTIYGRRRRKNFAWRANQAPGTRQWRADASERLTLEPVFVQIVRTSTDQATRVDSERASTSLREAG